MQQTLKNKCTRKDISSSQEKSMKRGSALFQNIFDISI